MHRAYRFVLWLTSSEQHLDLLNPIGRLARLVRSWEADIRGITAAEAEDLPYHTESLRHALRDLAQYRRELHHAFRQCRMADIPRWKIALACV